MELRRRFLTIGPRRVHYWRAGKGPPCILVHSSPANARLLVKEIEHLARDWTVFAFDTPGFGLSDPLPLAEMEVGDLADALAETLAALAMPRCPMFGTHTGAAIALEFAVRHPECVTGLVLDGVPAFTAAECEEYFGTYFQKMPPSALGGHYAEAWTRFRDQSIWFPWTNRTPESLNDYDLSPPRSTHLWVWMFFEAADHYAPAYRAASYYGDRAIAAAAALTVPAVYCATETDMLHPHLARLPAMKPGQAIIDIGTSYESKRVLIAQSFERYGADGPAPADRHAIDTSPAISRQFVDGSAGQLHLRFAGDRADLPLLLLHDAPGSAEQAEARIAELSRRFFVIAPDLPGHGESDPLPGVSNIHAYADEALRLLDTVGIGKATLYGIGFGASVALAVATEAPDRVAALALEGVLLPDAAERADLAAHYAPPIEIAADGAHWYRTWLMLRDSQIYWPWYDRRLAALRRVEADFGARRLHRWTLDVMRARESYSSLIAAALAHDAAAVLLSLEVPLVMVGSSASPLASYDERGRTLTTAADHVSASSTHLADRLAILSARADGNAGATPAPDAAAPCIAPSARPPARPLSVMEKGST